MQQYRVNYVLLIGLLVGSVLFSGAIYGLWRYQIERNASALITAAEKAIEEGDLRSAASHYGNYLSILPKDDEVRVKYALTHGDISESEDVRMEEVGIALNVIEETVRKIPEAKDLQLRLVKLNARVNRFQDALDHLGYMLEKYPDDTELQVLQFQYLVRVQSHNQAIDHAFQLIGYDETSETFDLEKAIAPQEAVLYRTVARLLRVQREQPKLADLVINQLVKANPDSYEAYLQRGQYFVQFKKLEEGEADLEKAYAMNPEDAGVLLALANWLTRGDDRSSGKEEDTEQEADKEAKEKAQKENFARAHKLLMEGKEFHPEDSRFYQALATLEMKENDYEAAMAYADEGLQAVTGRKAHVLLLFKSDLQFLVNDIKGVHETMEVMREANFRPAYIDWFDARILLAEGKWFKGSQALRSLRPRLADTPEIQAQINVQLGLCYERLGMPEMAMESYNLVLQKNPLNAPARYGKQRVFAKTGRKLPGKRNTSWQDLVIQELKKPKEEQDWTELDAQLEEVATERNMQGAARKLFKAELLVMRKEFAEARSFLMEAYQEEPDNLSVRRAAVHLLQRDPDQGPAKAMPMLEKIIEKFGDQVALRLDKANLFIAMNDSALKQQLQTLTQGIDDWTVQDKITLWKGLATKYLSLGMRDESQQSWNEVANLAPHDLPTRTMLFALAYDTNDDVAMKAAQDKILEVVQDKGNSTWLYSEARRLLSLYRRGRLEKSALEEIDQLANRALEGRPDWHQLFLVKAELALLQGDPQLALSHYEKAEGLGRINPGAIIQHVRLLVGRGRNGKAKLLIERLPKATRERMLGQLYAEVLFNTDNLSDALDSARLVIESDPKNAKKRLWHGLMLSQATRKPGLDPEKIKSLGEEAGQAFRKTVELNSKSPEAWLALFKHHTGRKEKEQAQEVLLEIQLELSSDQVQPVLAKCYEMMGRWFDAETMFQTIYNANPGNLRLVQQLAIFYLGPGYQQPDRLAKATPLINRLMRAGAEGELSAGDRKLLWARRKAAEMLASTKQYQQLLLAERLLASNSQEGLLPTEDRLRMAQILSPRPEPVSRLKAVHLLEEVKQDQRLNLSSELVLGKLYFAVGEWGKCEKQMREVISRFPDSVPARDSYIRMLLERGAKRDITQAGKTFKKLQELAPNNPRTLDLLVRISNKTGKQKQAQAVLTRMIPKIEDPKNIDEKLIPLLQLVASMLVELEDLEEAEKIYRLLATNEPSSIFQLAKFLGIHRDVDACFELLQEIYSVEKIPAMVQLAIGVLRVQRDEVGDKYDKLVQEWLDRTLLENPDSIGLAILQSDFYDVQKKYSKSAALYQQLLTRSDLIGSSRAVVLNNLSYLLAIKDSSEEGEADPLELVQEAVQILGPTADILDTRAVVFIARKQYQLAIQDLELSVTDNPSAAKYFHKAIAHLLAGENKNAIEAWEKGEQKGLAPEELNQLEHTRYEEMKSRIEALRSRSAA